MGSEVKNHIRVQSEHGLKGFSVKTGKILPGA